MGENTKENNNHYLTFLIGEEQYAIPVTDIREVLLVPKVTPIPRMPDFMRGVINIRGSGVPVLDLRRKFGMGQTEAGKDTSIIIVEIPTGKSEEADCLIRIGLYADCVNKVVILNPENIEPPPNIGMKVQDAFIKGMGHLDDSFLVILNIKAIFSGEDIELMETASVAEPTN